MRRIAIALLLCLPASAAAAQDSTLRSDTERLLARLDATFVTGAADPNVQQPTPPPPPPPSGRRRPSMVGYVGDATIGSQFRVRFDSAAEITAPDRAEFFYAKCGCYRGLPSDHPAFDPDAPGPGPGIASELDARVLMLQVEYAASDRLSVFGELPLRWTRPQAFVAGTGTFEDAGGVGDLRAGLKFGLVAHADQALTVQLQIDAPTGDAGKGLGTDHWAFSPTLLYFRRLSDRVVFESQLGTVHPIEGSAGIPTNGPDGFAGTVISYGLGASVELAPGSRLSVAPVVELFGWRVVDGFQTSTLGPADGTNIVNLKLGVRVGGDRGSVYLGYGRALTDDTWYHDIFRIEYRIGF